MTATAERSRLAFSFDPETHTYTLGKRRLPSVTEILRELGAIKGWAFFNETASLRGQKVHLACRLLEEGGLDWESLKPIESALGEPVEGYVKAWKRFLEETGWRSTLIEKPGYHADYLYAGTLDRIGDFPETCQECLLDIKTGPIGGWTALQTAGYDEMVPRKPGTRRRRYAIRLKPDGDYAIQPFTDLNDGQVFLNMVTAHRWLKEHGVYDE